MKNKNTISNSTINAGGNVHIGDIYTTGRAEPGNQSGLKKQLEDLIAKGRVDEALRLMSETNLDAETRQEVLQLRQRSEALARKNRMGIISGAESNLEQNNITASLLALIAHL
jgi:hypothetical protein